jgi:hypothetical protein
MPNTLVKKCHVLLFSALVAINVSAIMYFYWIKQEQKPMVMVAQRYDSAAEAPVTLFMRMTGLHIKRFYCDFLRTAVLFWPALYGKLVLVLDSEPS